MPISEKRTKEIIEDIAILASHFLLLCTAGKPISEDEGEGDKLSANILHNKDAIIACQELIVDLKKQLVNDDLNKALRASITFSHLTEQEQAPLVAFVLTAEDLLITLQGKPGTNDGANNEVNEQPEFNLNHHISLPQGLSDTTLAAIERRQNPKVLHNYLTDTREELTTKIWCLRLTRFFLGWWKSEKDCHSIDKKIECLVELRAVLESQQKQSSTSVERVHAVVERWKDINCNYQNVSEVRDKVKVPDSQAIVDKITDDTRVIFKKK